MDTTHLDPRALERAARELRALARALLRDEHGADELVQDAWVRALEQPPRAGLLARGWWRAVLRRAAQRRSMRERARRAREAAVARAEALPPADRARERAEIAQRVTAAVASLEEPFRTAIALRYLEELPPRAIARQLGVPLATVKSRLARGLRTLREELEASGRPPAAGWLAALALTALPAPSAAATTAALAFPLGVLAMKTKLAVAALLALALGIGLWSGADAWIAAREPRDAELARTAPAPRSEERSTPAPLVARTETKPAEVTPERADPEEPRREVESPARELHLRVIDFEGRPLASEAVHLAEGTTQLHDWIHETLEASENATRVEAPNGIVALTKDTWLLRPALHGRIALELLELRIRGAEALPPQTLRVDRARSLAVRVVDGERRPLEGLEVRCGPDGRARRERSAEHGEIAVRALQARWRTTDAEGRVALEIGTSEPWHLEVLAGSRRELRSAYRELAAGEAPLALEIELLPESAAKFRGRLVDESAQPIAEARIFFPSAPEHGTRSDVEGRFAFHDGPLLDPLRVEAEGFLPRQLHAFETPLGVERTVVLERGGALAGRIASDDPALLAELRLEAQPLAEEAARELHETRSDAHGRFAFPALRTGAHLLRALGSDGRTLAVARVEAPDREVVLALGTGLELLRAMRGRVVDARSGAPLANVELAALFARAGSLEWVSTSAWRTTSDGEGRFELRDLPWQPTLLSCELAGYVARNVQPRLYPPGTTELAIELDRERTLCARVLDLEGRPVAEAEVSAIDGAGEVCSLRTGPGSFSTFLHTDPEGRVVLAGLPARDLRLLARSDGWSAALPVEVAAEHPDEEIALRLAVVAHRLRRPLALELACLAATPHDRAELRVFDASARPCAQLRLARDGEGWFAELPAMRRLPADLRLGLQLPPEALELVLVLGGEERRVRIDAAASAARIE